MDECIGTLRASIPTLKSSLKTTTQKLKLIKSAPTSSDLAAMIETIRSENAAKREKLRGFKDGSIKQVSKEEMEGVEKEWKYWNGKRRVRKSAFEAVEDQLRDGMTKEEIWEKAGLEQDVL
jgi:hypothetical protein